MYKVKHISDFTGGFFKVLSHTYCQRNVKPKCRFQMQLKSIGSSFKPKQPKQPKQPKHYKILILV